MITGVVRYGFEPAYTIGDRVADAHHRIQSAVQTGTQGIRDVKLFGLAEQLRTELADATDQNVTGTVSLRRNEEGMKNFYQFSTAAILFVLVYGATEYTAITLAELGIFLFAMFRLSPRVSELNNLVYRVQGDLPHLVRTQTFIRAAENSVEPSGGNRALPDRIKRLTFDDVTFSYDDERVLADVSFEVDRGEFAAFAGPSGAGKSTLVSLVSQLYRPDDGEIAADGTPINEFGLDEWRSRVAVIRQSPFIFNESLRDNIAVGDRDASDAELQTAARTARVTEFLDELPDGYATMLGDDGVRLSGGQRQRVAIARALLTDADIIVLDEATSDLDTTLERDVHGAVERQYEDRIVLVVAHRLSTIRGADIIYTLNDGRIVESGTHEELVKTGGTYASLYRRQAKG